MKAISICMLLIFPFFVSAKNETDVPKRNRGFSIAPHYGFIMPHRSEMTHLIQGHSYGFFASYYRPLNKTAMWHSAYNFPEQGIDLGYINTGNQRQLGSQFAVKYWLELPLNRFDPSETSFVGRGFQHWIGLGLGIGYATKAWDLENNHQSAVLGSQINNSLNLQYSVRLFEFGTSELRAGLRISHLSNGAFQLPNLGTNNACIFLSYHHKNVTDKSLERIEVIVPEKYRLTASISGGLKEIPPPTGKKYGIGVFSFLAERRLTYKSSVGIGTDVFYNSAIYALLERRTEGSIKRSNAIQNGLLLSYTLHFDDFELKMQQGFYIRDNWKVDGTLYHRFGLRYRINEHVFASLMLKTHFAKADFGELGMGYSF